MKSSPVKSLKQAICFLQLENCEFKSQNRKESYDYINQTVRNLDYWSLRKKARGIVINFLAKVLGYSKPQIKRLIKKSLFGNLTVPQYNKNKTSYSRKYTNDDIRLLAEIDSLANYPNAHGLMESLHRMYFEFRDDRFKRLSCISKGHIYNLRKTDIYRKVTLKYEHTRAISNNLIGVREKPNPDNKPGYIRVDSVHGGEKDGEKGVYYVNFVDEVTQFEIVICVQAISEQFLGEVWEEILVSFPFRIVNFHSDNGSEFINKVVVKILNTLNIRQTKSRPRHSNDNGLVETKNGSVIRKHFGYLYRHQECAPIINDYLDKYFNRFLNYHRPCAFPTKIVDKQTGKVTIKYNREDYKTPYDKLKLLDPKGEYLQSGFSYENLDKIAKAYSDFEYLKLLKNKREEMIRKVEEKMFEIASPKI